jgi:uncharacterized protein (TIGR00375 family)
VPIRESLKTELYADTRLHEPETFFSVPPDIWSRPTEQRYTHYIMYIADLHIHSKYSRATSPDGDAPHLDLWARKKGITLVGTGDFTHPVWRRELREALVPAESGLYTLKSDLQLPAETAGNFSAPRFIVTGEISSIYKKNGKTRKIHNLILLPGLDDADRISKKLETIGNIHSDGRPILGLDCRDLLEIVLETCPEAVFIPAHIWTPHFALFGAFSGFDTIEECFEDLTTEIHAVETGLSSDPPMNWRVSALDRFTLVSNSDAHSPSKLGREANLLNTGLSYPELKHAVETGDGFAGTIEFFPEEGKYHLDGHRDCLTSLTPDETRKLDGKCPVCGKKITIGVLHRVLELADRPDGYRPPDAKPFESLMPLPEVIADSTGNSAENKKTEAVYALMLRELGPEFTILRESAVDDIARIAGPCVAEGIRRLRERKVERIAGYDGKYGVIRLFDDEDRDLFSGQSLLFDIPGTSPGKRTVSPHTEKLQPERKKEQLKKSAGIPTGSGRDGLNEEQVKAVTVSENAVAVIAGPGTGKTKTLVSRIAYLIESRGVSPSEITAVTFTNKAASEMRTRLEQRLGGPDAVRGLTIGTFHAVCLRLLDRRPVVSENEALFLMQDILAGLKIKKSPRGALRAVSEIKNGRPVEESGIDEVVYEKYCSSLKEQGLRDLDDLLLDALKFEKINGRQFTNLLVDEFQDINAVQRRLVRHWSSGEKSLFVIGDPDQSIYGFRGASASCFTGLQNDFPALRIISLRRNYRSSPEIVSCALFSVSRNPGGKRELEAVRPSGAAVRLVSADTALSEGIWIAKEIARITGGLGMLDARKYVSDEQEKRPFSDIAVLCRTHRQLEKIEYCLQHDSIPYVVSGRGGELDDPAVQGALAFFRFLLVPDDTTALTTALRLVWNCSAEQTAGTVSAYRNSTASGTLNSTLRDAGCPPQFCADTEKYLPRIQKEKPEILLAEWAESHEKNTAADYLTGIAAFHTTMSGLLDALTFGEEADLCRASRKTYESGAVQLMTLHGSKGLEFPVVFLSGLSAGMFPLEREDVPADIEEERRLLFVGMTRAKDELILTASEPVSDFVNELPGSVQRCVPDFRRRTGEVAQPELF